MVAESAAVLRYPQQQSCWLAGLGSHRETRVFDYSESMLEERREAGDREVQMVAPRGSLAIRDMRLLHGGRPNHTSYAAPTADLIAA